MDFQSILVSTGVVTLAEMGDKTQLLAFLLAAKYKKPVPIILGILFATILNHGLAGLLGSWITHLLSPEILRWVLGLSFIAMALWTLVPDKIDDDEASFGAKSGVFITTLVTFFLAEMGDKTQVATVAMAAHYSSPIMVVLGTTLGMMLADVPAVFLGNSFAKKLPLKLIHSIAAGIFFVMGVLVLLKIDQLF
ncbi:TMEM165/GDT1 family protein [Polynucleobacter kasalickyi]|uniref:GDT1 family protein n=1 Tax=Polynucleobacter kasalickyi TaxID=1938817 RepID=A0A1W2AX49_9BURK|nr:TMEM165/GDT1 family protein [Polynucleobacter kasalickyi]SMC65317.1 Putative Ca2+/H+ antiporter, TMEM165/GDT1 family [Polynucleobacter kasalickyi]